MTRKILLYGAVVLESSTRVAEEVGGSLVFVVSGMAVGRISRTVEHRRGMLKTLVALD